VNQSYRTAALAACASLALMPAAALAQRQQASPEQRIDRLERQIDQMQRQVFPRGRPADTAGFSTEPAATQSSVVTLDQRLNALERQMTDLLRQSEENGHRLQSLEGDIGKIRADSDQRIGALEQRIAETPPAPMAAPVTAPANDPPAARTPVRGKPSAGTPKPTPAAASDAPAPAEGSATAVDAGEDAYTAGFHQWEAGQYDQAIASLKAFTAAYPKHRRVSYANNLIGRAMLDNGDPRSAAEVLLANYRNNPRGERAQDSLYYLGQSLVKLGQPGQACKAYAELESVYGSKVRPDLQKMLTSAKSQAQCS
jgi:TolA-binding protein